MPPAAAHAALQNAVKGASKKSRLPGGTFLRMGLIQHLDERGLIAIGLGDWCQPGVGAGDYDTPLVVTDTILTYDIAMKAAFVYEELGQEPGRCSA